jgi:hypothetical protein
LKKEKRVFPNKSSKGHLFKIAMQNINNLPDKIANKNYKWCKELKNMIKIS